MEDEVGGVGETFGDGGEDGGVVFQEDVREDGCGPWGVLFKPFAEIGVVFGVGDRADCRCGQEAEGVAGSGAGFFRFRRRAQVGFRGVETNRGGVRGDFLWEKQNGKRFAKKFI